VPIDVFADGNLEGETTVETKGRGLDRGGPHGKKTTKMAGRGMA